MGEMRGVEEDDERLYISLPRERELEMATSRPLFSGAPMRVADPSELYPNVYDSMAKARLSSAYLDGRTVRVSKLTKSARLIGFFC